MKTQPAPAYLVCFSLSLGAVECHPNLLQIRTIVHTFASRPELLENGETTEDHRRHQREEAERVEKDKSDTDPKTGGLFKGKFKARPPIRQPVLDLEDNVFRCPQCSWELEEDDGCVRCGYHPDDVSVTTGTEGSDLDDNSEMTDYFDDEAEDGLDETDDLGWNVFGVPTAGLPPNLQDHLYDLHPDYSLVDYHIPRGRRFTPMRPGGGRPAPVEMDDDDEDEDDDEDDMDSFIDDDINGGREHVSDSDHSTVVGDQEHRTQRHYDSSQLSSEASMSDDTSDSLEEDVSGSESDEDVDEDRIQPPPCRRLPRLNAYALRNAQPFQSASRLFHADQFPLHDVGSSARTAINVDDDSDEGPVGPIRRTRPKRNGQVSAY